MAPSVIVARYKGYADESFVPFFEAIFTSTFGDRQGIHLFIDCEEQTGYSAAFRERIAEFVKKINSQTRTQCILVRSRIVAFGVAVVHALVGSRMQIVSSRDEFDARLERAVRDATSHDAA